MNPALIFHLLKKEFLLELRQKYALNGIILYVFSTLFIIQLGFFNLRPDIWITLFWIVVLFASVNAGAKSFIQEGRARLLYYYVISSPQDIILSKFIYNCILLLLLALLSYAGFLIFFENVIQNTAYFLFIIFLGSVGFSGTFTMISGIASKARGSATLMTILSFPLIIPQLMLLIRLSRRAADGFEIISGGQDLLSLIAVNILVAVVSYLLFPYLWRD